MYIFHCSWAQDGCNGLNAVVVAYTEKQALEMLHLTEDDKCQKATIIGVSQLRVREPTIFAHESL